MPFWIAVLSSLLLQTGTAPGEGFHNNRHRRTILPDSLRWLRRDYAGR